MHRADRRTNRIYSVPKAIAETPKKISQAVKAVKANANAMAQAQANNVQPTQ